jgi:hypothetical protein
MAAKSDNEYDTPMAHEVYEKPKLEVLGSLHDMTLANTWNPYEADGGTSYVTVCGYTFPAIGSF